MFEEYDAARELIHDAADFNGGLSGGRNRLALRFLVEMGNCARYAHIYANALEMYEAARGILQFTAEGEMRERNADMLLLNVAIVFRGLGRYGKALSTLETLVAKRPDHADGQHSLAVLRLRAMLRRRCRTSIGRSFSQPAGAYAGAGESALCREAIYAAC